MFRTAQTIATLRAYLHQVAARLVRGLADLPSPVVNRLHVMGHVMDYEARPPPHDNAGQALHHALQ
jgi:hypothetical protein